LKKWKIKKDPLLEQNMKGITNQSLKRKLNRKIKSLQRDPDIGKQLRPPLNYLWEINVNGFRLYYEIWEKQITILLRAFYPKRLQKRYLKGKVKSD